MYQLTFTDVDNYSRKYKTRKQKFLEKEDTHWSGRDLWCDPYHGSHTANISDVDLTEKLLHGEESTCHEDAGYVGVDKRDEFADLAIDRQIAPRLGKFKQMVGVERERERQKGVGASQGRAPIPPHQHTIWVRQSEVLWSGEKLESVMGISGIFQPACVSTCPATDSSLVRLESV